MKVGTEMSGGVSNVVFEDSTIEYAGIALKLSAPLGRGGSVKNVTWRRLNVKRAGMLISVGDNHALDTQPPKKHPPPPPGGLAAVDGVTFEDVVLHNASCCPVCDAGGYGCGKNAGCKNTRTVDPQSQLDFSEMLLRDCLHTTGLLAGVQDPTLALRNLVLRNVSVTAGKGTNGQHVPLPWVCSPKGSLIGTAEEVTPALVHGCLEAPPPPAAASGTRSAVPAKTDDNTSATAAVVRHTSNEPPCRALQLDQTLPSEDP